MTLTYVELAGPGTLSDTAARMLATLPDYFWTDALLRRIVQAWANEIDRVDAMLDAIKQGLIPGVADDTVGMLAIWEQILELPAAPAGVTLDQRQASVKAKLQQLWANSAKDVLAVFDTQLGGSFYSITRDSPAAFEDTVNISAAAGFYVVDLFERVMTQAWPAHRLLHFAFEGGFILDVSELDRDLM